MYVGKISFMIFGGIFSGQLRPAACGGGPQRRDGAEQVSCLSLAFQLCILETCRKDKKLTWFVSFSLDFLGDLEDTDWRDTVQLYKEEVRRN